MAGRAGPLDRVQERTRYLCVLLLASVVMGCPAYYHGRALNDTTRETRWRQASLAGDVAELERLVRWGYDPARNGIPEHSSWDFALQITRREGHEEAVRFLVREFDYEPGRLNAELCEELASSPFRQTMWRELMKLGAKFDCSGIFSKRFGKPPIAYAIDRSPKLVAVVLEAGLSPDAFANRTESALCYAVTRGEVESAALLLKAGANTFCIRKLIATHPDSAQIARFFRHANAKAQESSDKILEASKERGETKRKDRITELQKGLTALGFDVPSNSGAMDLQTREMTANFMREIGWSDGWVDDEGLVSQALLDRIDTELAVIGSKGVRHNADVKPPLIKAPETLSTDRTYAEFSGSVSDESNIIEVTVDGSPLVISTDGSFSIRRGVPIGQSTILISAIDEWGNEESRSVLVTRTPSFDLAKGSGSFGRYYALIIGNNNYNHLGSLRTARGDAEAVAALLSESYGFTVSTLLDATRSDIVSNLARSRSQLTKGDNLLIYYAGHGWYDKEAEQGYWLPVDAQEENPSNWISNATINDMLRANPAKHVMVVADSCFSGALTRGISIEPHSRIYLQRLAAKRARTALTSGGLEPVEDGGGSGHSAFALAFLNALRENAAIIDGHTLFTAIRRPVMINADQTPEYGEIRKSGHEGGDFLFVRQEAAE